MSAPAEILGLVGVVVSRLRGAAGPGEVRVVHGGLPHTYIAHADREVPVGTHILVINVRGKRQIDVEPWALQTQFADNATGSHNHQARS
ncbi:MAG: hypothetical protein QOE84_2597 [Actinomycetota bacterium]|jgi:hypothetical protein|nr:hypothetical protein [Actinomycetota bacterium]